MRIYKVTPTETLLLRGRRINADTGCWEWTGATLTKGYGIVFDYTHKRPRQVHRVAARLWLDFADDDPKQMVLHECDNRLCFNPEHLYIGTGADNARDREERHPQTGERNRSAKLTWARVAEIRSRAGKGETHESIAIDMGVSRSAVSMVVRGATWNDGLPEVKERLLVSFPGMEGVA